MKIIAIDPGQEKSGIVLYNTELLPTQRITKAEVAPNELIRSVTLDSATMIVNSVDVVVIERVRSYNQIVGNSTLDTAEWAGRFYELALQTVGEKGVFYVPRKDALVHLIGRATGNDARINQALKDRFEPTLQPRQRPKGLLKPLNSHTRAAFAILITWLDKHEGRL